MSNHALPVPPKKAALELKAIFDNATVGILFTHSRRLIQANALCAEMFGYTLGEFIDQPALILYSDQEAYSALGREAGPVLAAGRAFRTETQLKRKDGNLLWCRVSAKAVDPEHPSDGTLWIIEDISEDRLMIEALERSTRELSAILDTASVGIGVVRNRVFVRCNRRFEEIFGLPEGTLVGQSSRWLFNSDEEFQRVGEQVYAEFAAGAVHRREQSYLRRDGRTVWVRVSGGAFDATNPHAGSVWLAEDFTATHEAEQRARQAFEEQQIIFEDPMGQDFNETRTDLDASITGVGAEDLKVVEVIKPIVRCGTKNLSRVVQKGIVVVESKSAQPAAHKQETEGGE